MQLLSRVRGFAVGYCLGDALARSPTPDRGPLIGGTPTLLFLAGIEGLIRGLVRESVTGRPGGVPDACWHATARWASRTRQESLPGVAVWREAAQGRRWPDGWLSELALLEGGRGSAPAVEAALELGSALDPRPGYSGADSAGDLVLSRTLPIAFLAATTPVHTPHPIDDDLGLQVSTLARDVAAYSHGLPAQVVAVALTRTVAGVLTSGEVSGLADLASLSAVYDGVPGGAEIVAARVALHAVSENLPPHPRSTSFVSHGVPSGPRSALRATTDGLRFALSHPGRHDVVKAVAEMVEMAQPAAGAVGLGLLGAAHGIGALPADAVDRLDLGHVADALAIDLVTQITGGPLLGDDHEAATDWLDRYPAW
ncbi:MAG: hypothetical protein HGA44_10005 [Cellulomonadaceae bacterium]|nr:hypothetical protein [Cellulomonadaceae bacterium]